MQYVNERERSVIPMVDFVYRILSFNVVGRPGCVCIEILKDREHGETGVKIINTKHMPAGLIVK